MQALEEARAQAPALKLFNSVTPGDFAKSVAQEGDALLSSKASSAGVRMPSPQRPNMKHRRDSSTGPSRLTPVPKLRRQQWQRSKANISNQLPLAQVGLSACCWAGRRSMCRALGQES